MRLPRAIARSQPLAPRAGHLSRAVLEQYVTVSARPTCLEHDRREPSDAKPEDVLFPARLPPLGDSDSEGKGL